MRECVTFKQPAQLNHISHQYKFSWHNMFKGHLHPPLFHMDITYAEVLNNRISVGRNQIYTILNCVILSQWYTFYNTSLTGVSLTPIKSTEVRLRFLKLYCNMFGRTLTCTILQHLKSFIQLKGWRG